MGAADLLERVRAAGFVLDVADGMLLVTPASKLTDELRTALRDCKLELVALLIGEPANGTDRVPSRTCRDCAHRLPRGTCREPEAAGLFPPDHGFGIEWGDDDHAVSCPAFTPKTTAAASSRPYRLTKAEGDAAHADPWADGTIARFLARVASIRRRGFTEQDAEDLAERVHLLDVQAEGRRLCLTCWHLAGSTATGWSCGNHEAADMPRELAPELVTTAQCCPGFTRRAT